MNKYLIFSITLLQSIISSANTYRVPNRCEVAFIKDFTRYLVKVERVTPRPYGVQEILKIVDEPDLTKKINLLESQYDLVSREYNAKIEMIEEEFQNLGKEKNLSFEEIEKLMVLPKKNTLIESFEHLNAITKASFDILKKEGFSIFLKERSFKDVDLKSLYLEIADFPTNKYFNSVATINRYKTRFGTKTVTFDFMQNMKNGSAGFSQASTKRIDLGFRGMRNMVLDDLITMVGKHEFKHAAFASNRVTGRESIYHAQYISRGANPLSTIPNHYDRYMSAEELYNFTNNPFWASTRIGNIEKFKPEDYLKDLEGIYYYIKSTNSIAAQTQEITQTVIDYLKSNLKQGNNLAIEMNLLTESGELAKTVEEVRGISFFMPEKEIVYADWIGSKEYQADIKIIMENHLKLNLKYQKSYDEASDEVKKEILKLYSAEKSILNHDANSRVIKKLITKQESLNQVSKKIIPINEEVIKQTEDFMDYFVARRGIDPNLLKSKDIIEKFNELRLAYRKLGDHVKEDFKGFIGH